MKKKNNNKKALFQGAQSSERDKTNSFNEDCEQLT